MANNYTTSYPTTAEFFGDSVSAGTLPSTYDIIITPDVGYTVQASDFSIGSTLPSEVTQVVFTDTTTALDITNKVRARVHLASWYTMPATATSGYSGVVIEVDIDGATHQHQARLGFVTTNTSVDNLVITRSFNGTSTEVTDGSVITNSIYQDITRSTTAQVCQMIFTAADDYYISSIPSFRITSNDLSKWKSTTTGHTYNSDNKLTSIIFTFNYSIGTQNINATDGESIIFISPSVIADPVSCISIYSAYLLGLPNQSILPTGNTTLQLFVSGSENSTYNIKVETDNEKTYDFSSDDGTFSRELTVSDAQTIYSPTEQILRGRDVGRNQHLITIPYLVGKDRAASQTYTTTVTPTGSTFSNTSCTGTNPFTITLNQFGQASATLSVNAADAAGVSVASTTIKATGSQNALSYLTTFNPTDFPRLSTDSNGYFTYSSALSYSVTDTVNGAFSGTTMVLDNTYTSKNIEVGDAITGPNIDTATTITATNVGSNAYTYTLSKSPTTEVLDGVVITFTRTVGISRQPVFSDFINLSESFTFQGGYSTFSRIVTQDSSNSPFITIDNVDNVVAASTTIVQGNNIVGYPTVDSINGNDVRLSTNQNLTAGDIVTFSYEMMEAFISEINVTGAGTSSCLLNIDGYIQRIGKSSVSASLLLKNFITTYAAPTAAAGTATATHGESIVIEPLSTCTGHTGTLTIGELSDEGRTGVATISADGQHILYTAPSSGTSDTIAYIISDGISTSASADIIVTLTSY